jgi:D-alanine--poly(phosphoribitol) ligase subunit 2
MSNADKILDLVANVAEVDEVRQDPELPLYDLHILDSLKTVELIVAFSDAFGLEISPADLERGQWATPRLIVADLERRLAAAA